MIRIVYKVLVAICMQVGSLFFGFCNMGRYNYDLTI
jgi:hypothetical protein